MRHPHSHNQTASITMVAIMLIAMTTPLITVAESVNIASLPDPTQRLGTGTSSFSNGSGKSLRLQSILYSGQRKSIVINGYLKEVGSIINGSRIIEIRHNTVVISHQGRLQTLRLSTSKSVRQRGAQP